MTRLRPAAAFGAAVLATLLAVPATAEDPPAAGGVADVEDQVLQITLNRLVAEAPLFGSFLSCEGVVNPCDVSTYAQISVIRLDTGEHAEVNGETAQISLSSVKVLWVTMAVGELGIEALEPYATDIFAKSSDIKAGEVIDLLGDQPSDGIDFINAATAAWGLGDTWAAGWFNPRVASTPYPEGMGVWGRYNYTTPDDLAAFWVMLNRGELLGPEETAQILEWAALPRLNEYDEPDDSNELIPNRLPAAVAAEVAHKTGWSDGGGNRRIDGGVVTTPGGIEYAIVISFRAGSAESFDGGAADWARYSSCEVYNLIAGTGHTCTRTGDPYEIVNHTTAPIGALNKASAERDQLRVGGWALDRDAGAGPIDVRITVDGAAVGTIVADRLKTLVHDKKGMGNYHGFKAALDVDLSPGDHRVCAVAINDSAMGSNHTVGCKTVIVSDDHPPVGNLATAMVRKDRVIAGGWAKDADTAGPIDVKITLDGSRLRLIQADRGGGGHGFWLSVSVPLPVGEHEICAIAQNFEDGGPNRTIGCETVTVPDDWPPSGVLVAATAGANEVWVKGRARDEDTTDPIEVRVEVDGSLVGSVFSYRGPVNRRYSDTLPLLPAMEPGPHEVCTIAVNHTGGDPTTPLGCLTVVVPDA